MKILITGATGLVGRALGKELSALGHELTVISRTAQSAKENLNFKAHIVEGDLSQGPVILKDSYDGVINLMGESLMGRWTDKKKLSILASRETATLNLLESLKSTNLSFFISASAVGIYGERGDERLTESSPPGAESDFLVDVCAKWEAAAKRSLAKRVILARIGMIVHPYEGALTQMKFPFKAGAGGIIGDGKQIMSWIDYRDLVQAFIHFVQHEKSQGVYNLTSPQAVSNREFSQSLAHALQRPLTLPIPKIMLKTIFGEMSQVMTASQNVYPERLLSEGFSFKYVSIRGSLEECLKDQAGNLEVMYAEQFVPQPIEKLFAFFSDEKNLEEITPKLLNFKVLQMSTEKIEEGSLIDYRLKIRGVPARWRTRIENWNPPHEFVDNQLLGPYKKWHHTHQFKSVPGGTLMTDRVIYELPVGYLGWLGGRALVQKDVGEIFKYRRQWIAKFFA